MELGTKHDQEKNQVELLSPLWLLGVGRVLTFGARKYTAHNWRQGIRISRLLGAALRHLLAFLGGEDRDPETGLLHLYHCSCCLMFACELFETRPDLDDRYKMVRIEPLRADEDACICHAPGNAAWACAAVAHQIQQIEVIEALNAEGHCSCSCHPAIAKPDKVAHDVK